ncbi:MAG: hypothetical protein AAF658_19930, partial [Myxococcota bacterium]
PIPGEERFQSLVPSDELTGTGAAEIGVGEIDDELFLQLQLRTEFSLGKLGVGLSVPINIALENSEEQDRFDIRQADYDEPFDYLRLIRYFRYGNKRDPLYFRVGELASQIGHGTIMSRYVNNLDLNTYRLGIELDVNTDYGGIETMVGDVGSVFSDKNGSRVVGVRGYIKPIAFADPESVFNRLAVGMSYVADLNAPRLIDVEETEPGQFQPVVEDASLVAEEEGSQGVLGVDVEYELVNNAVLSVVPYSDLNFIDGAGAGWHLGTNVVFKFPIFINFQLPVRLEYRRFNSDYRPIYFSNFYEIERFDYLAEDTNFARDGTDLEDAARPTPKSEFIRELGDQEGGGINGYYADAAFDFIGILQLGAIYEDYEGGDPNVAVFLNVPALEVVQFKAFYTKTGIVDLDDLATLDDRSYAVAQGQIPI